MNIGSRFVLVAVVMAISISALPAGAADTEAASVSKLTGTSFGATPERDLRPIAISTVTDYLDQGAKLSDPAAKISDVEVIFWRGAVTPQSVAAYQKLVTDNLTQGGYTYRAIDPQTASGVTTTRFEAVSTQQVRIIGYWQTSSQGMYMNWGRVSGAAAPPNPPVEKAAGQSAVSAPAAGDKDAEIAELKRKLAEAEAAKTGALAPSAAPNTAAVPAAAGPVAAQATDNTALQPLDQSNLVTKSADGALIVAAKDGSGIDGVKLSKHDLQMGSPSIAVAPDGTVHVVFNEINGTTLAHAIYHCSSSDGGKTWTEPKNLTEELPGPGIDVGHCQVLADSQNRVYVIWRAGLRENWPVSIDPAGDRSDLWFRELEGGKWSKAKIFNEPVATATNDAPRSFFGAVDAAGRVQIIWNVQPDKWHPELIINGQHQPGVGVGLVFQCNLDGATSSKPHEVFLPVIGGMDKGARSSPSCDDLDTLNGYFDSAGAAHFVASVAGTMYGVNPHRPDYELMENGKTVQTIKLPELSYHAARDIPTLLVDAKGKRHLIAMYLGGEHPNIRDYPLGTDDEPTVIRAAVGLKGVIDGFQAYQGPGGRMAVLMQMNDTGERHTGDNFVSISTGDGKWSTPVNITNNVGRKTFHSTQTSSESNVAELTSCIAGAGAIAFDRDGHLLVVAVKGEYKMVAATAFGVNTAGADVVKPTLRFLKF